MIEARIKKIYGSINANYRITFIGAIICGLCAHLYQFTNKIPNYDEYGQTPAGVGATLEIGRWGLELMSDIYSIFFGWFSFPMVNGLVTLVLISISACIIVASYEVKDKIICFLIGGIAVVYPVVVSTYFFMFTAPYYGLSLLFSCISSYVFIKCDMKPRAGNLFRLLCAVLLMSFSAGIYQAYAAVFVSMLLIDIVIRCYKSEDDTGALIKRGIIYCVGIVLSLLLYFAFSKFFNWVYGVKMSSYRGMDSLGKLTVGRLIYGLLSCYRAFFGLMTKEDVLALNYSTVMKLIYCVLICFILVSSIINLFDKRKALATRVLMLLGTLMLPAAFFFIFILSQFGDGAAYTLMFYSAAFIFIYPLILCDKFESVVSVLYDRICKILTWSCAAAAALGIVIYFWYANANYQGLQYTHYHDMAYFQTLMTQVKSLDGYEPDMPVAILGEFNDETNDAGSLMEYHFRIGGKWETNINYKNRVMLWYCYLGFTPNVIEDKETLTEISEKPEVKNMPLYPSSGSVAIVDDIVVIKANDTVESYALY